jgi:hypothetical protein
MKYLRNRSPLRRPHLPATIALDEDIGEPQAPIHRLALSITPHDAVDPRDDCGVPLDPDVQLGKVERL